MHSRCGGAAGGTVIPEPKEWMWLQGLEHWPDEMEPEGQQYQDALGRALLPDIQGKLGMSYVQTSQANVGSGARYIL